jgi:ATP-dependent Clp protease ATP-binding subunit ClpC
MYNSNEMEKQLKNLPKASIEDDDAGDEKFKSPKKQVDPKSKTPVLDSFSRDLTKLAEEGKIDPIIGREKEIERVSQILSRKKKSNAILVGEPGCVDGDTIITVRKISNEDSHQIITI